MNDIRNAAVIGAGVMGAGIAAHLANAGVDVVLLDLDAAVAEKAVAAQVRSGGFMDPQFASRVRTGSTTKDMSLIADADWIVEAVVERLGVKHAVYQAIDQARKPGAIVSSNTSTIPLDALLQKASPNFAANFLITHFFNPPRWMRLLEIVDGPSTHPAVAQRIAEFADIRLGKGIVVCKDTPGFVANRIGTYWMGAALNQALKLPIPVEEADAFLGRPFGIPDTGVFGLLDLIGIDLMPSVHRSLQDTLPETDPYQSIDAEPPLIGKMIAQGRTGRKAGAGFFRRSADRQRREVLDLSSETYRDYRKPTPASEIGGPREAMEHASLGGQLAGDVMRRTLSYAAMLVPEISDSIADVDEAMRLGYGWKYGPFELIDRLGADWLVGSLDKAGMVAPSLIHVAAEAGGFYRTEDKARACLSPARTYVPISRPDGVIALADLKLATKPVEDSATACLWDIGDGVAALELKTKLNTLNTDVLVAIENLLGRVEADFSALVIATDLPVFSAGADLRLFLNAVEANDIGFLRSFIDTGQRVFQTLKRSPYPVVAGVAGRAVGGGLELALHCDAIQAHAEMQIGLVETSVGVIPAWGGCKELLLRVARNPDLPHGPVAPALHAFDVIAGAKVSANAFDARKLGFLQTGDGITMNRDRLIADAKAKALHLSKSYVAPEPQLMSLSGPSGAAAIGNIIDAAQLAGRLTPHDRFICERLAYVLSGGDVDPSRQVAEEHVLELEREVFLELVATEATRERIAHMLTHGKRLHN